MNRFKYLLIYAVLIIITGMVLMILAYMPGVAIQYCVSAGFALSALFAFLTAYKSKGLLQSIRYHALHAIGMLAYSIAVIVLGYDVQHFFTITILFLSYYGIAEMLFCVQLAALERYISIKVVLARLVIGLLITIGAIAMFFTTNIDKNMALAIGGLVLVMSGVSQLFFKTALVKHVEQTNAYSVMHDKMNHDYLPVDNTTLKSSKWTIENSHNK